MAISMMDLRQQIEALSKEALRLQGLAFDNDYYRAHVHLSNIDSEARSAIAALLSDPPIDMRGGAQQ